MIPTLKNAAAQQVLRPAVRLVPARQVVAVLREHPMHRVWVDSFRVQADAACVGNTRTVLHEVVRTQHEARWLTVTGAPPDGASMSVRARHAYGPPMPDIRLDSKQVVEADHVVRAWDQHGTLSLTLIGLLPPEHGGDEYPAHHAVLVVGLFNDGGERWCLALDGNDQRGGDTMAQFRDYAGRYYPDEGGRGQVQRIHPGDWPVIQAQMNRAGLDADVEQMTYALINLDRAVPYAHEMYEANRKDREALFNGTRYGMPNEVTWCKNATRCQSDLSESTLDMLRAYIWEHPGEVYLPLSAG